MQGTSSQMCCWSEGAPFGTMECSIDRQAIQSTCRALTEPAMSFACGEQHSHSSCAGCRREHGMLSTQQAARDYHVTRNFSSTLSLTST